jgi:TonB family protein
MKRNSIKAGVLPIITGILMSLFIISCNDDDSADKKSETMGEATAAKDSAKTTVKKKGKASVARAKVDTGKPKIKKDKDGVYSVVETMPVYPGNEQGISDYISNNITYPQQALDNNTQGTVNVEFVVDEKGAISDVKTVGDKLGNGLEEEAVNVVSKLGTWTPGKVKGKNVKTRLNLPVTYKLEE